jgi:hypothetical protein
MQILQGSTPCFPATGKALVRTSSVQGGVILQADWFSGGFNDSRSAPLFSCCPARFVLADVKVRHTSRKMFPDGGLPIVPGLNTYLHISCGCSSTAERQSSTLVTRVRFPSPAPGYGAVWSSAPVWGTGGRVFESPYPDVVRIRRDKDQVFSEERCSLAGKASENSHLPARGVHRMALSA